jgi:hypothetical protein
MKSQIANLLGTAAVLAALSFTPALAQGTPDRGGPAASPPTSGAMESGGAAGPRSGTTSSQPSGATGAGPGAAGAQGGAATEAQTPGRTDGARGEKSTEQTGRPSEGRPAGETKESVDRDKAGTKATEGKTGDTSAGRDGGRAKIEPQQVQKVKTYFSSHKPTVKRVERSSVSVSVGVAVPAAVALYPLPPDVVVVSGDCPLQYFVWGDDVVLVDSCSRQVVQILVGVA